MQVSETARVRATLASVVALLASAVPSSSHAEPGRDLVQEINQRVAEIDKAIGSLPFISISEEILTEGVPPAYRMYFRRQSPDKLVAAVVTVGHETWATIFSYYFDDQQRPLKYLKACSGLPDCPSRAAIIYGPDRKVIWKNTEEPAVLPSQILALFSTIARFRIPHSAY
jgi:hypothetical protein